MKNSPASDLTCAVPPKERASGMQPLHAFAGFAIAGAFILAGLSATFVTDIQQNTHWIVAGIVFYAVGAGLAGYRLKRSYRHAALGLCNIITLVRLMLVSVLVTALMTQTPPDWATFAIAACALVLDGADGWMARKQGLASTFGAQFDVEVDAVFALILALYAASSGAAGAFVILLGLPHYLFWLARLRWPWLNADLSPSFARKAVCVFQIAALIALQLPFLAGGRLDLVILAVTLSLVWSFGRDILWLWRTQT
jgi:phosphatidylglycerophosphate synthase